MCILVATAIYLAFSKNLRNKAGPSQIFKMLGSRLQVGARCLNVAQFCLCEGLGLGHFEPRAQTEGGVQSLVK